MPRKGKNKGGPAAQAGPSKKKKNKNKQRRGPGGTSNMSGSRGLLVTHLPKHRIQVSGNRDGMTVEGSEVILRANTSAVPVSYYVALNPTNAQVFPRLSTLSLDFERFKFVSIQAEYYTACPATRSGSVALVTHTQYIAAGQGPSSLQVAGNFNFSALGTVAAGLRTQAWSTVDPEWFFVGNQSTAGVDPFKTNQGTLQIILSDSVAADANLVAGYWVVHYRCMLRNWRPAPQRVIAATITPGTNAPQTDFKSGTTQLVPRYEGTVNNQIGTVPLAPANTVANGAMGITTGDMAKKIFADLVSGLQYVYGWYGSFGNNSSVPDSKSPDDFQVVADYKQRTQLTRRSSDAESKNAVIGSDRLMAAQVPRRAYYNRDTCLPMSDAVACSQEEMVAIIANAKRGLHADGTPFTAGDVTISNYTAVPDDNVLVPVSETAQFSTTFSPGTGAFMQNEVVTFTTGLGQTVWYSTVIPTGTETRALLTWMDTIVPNGVSD